jgi:S-DNA-T family DNA segregation ATPase FtsK/SpoIIIE
MKENFTKKDALYPEVKKFAKKIKDLTVAQIQEKFRTGSTRSLRLMDMLKADRVIKPKKIPTMAKLERLYKDKDWKQFKNKPIIPLGMDSPTNCLVGNLENNYNLIIAGAKGSGKSNFFHCAIVNLLRNTKPTDLKLILINPKKVEFSLYDNLPNLIFPVISNLSSAKEALQWCISENNRRLQLLAREKEALFVEEYNKKYKDKLPRILIVIDEFSDLMSGDARFFKKAILEILGLGMMTNINIMIGTSRPSPTKVYPKKLVNVFRNRIAFKTATSADSKTMIGLSGAKKLHGKGDALLKHPGEEGVTHLQGFYVSHKEVKKVVASVKS